LGDLEQDHVFARFSSSADVLIHGAARMVDGVGGEQFAVEPNLVGVDAAEPHLAATSLGELNST
jgi:hypothetical protein